MLRLDRYMGNAYYFDTDDDFINFCMDPTKKVTTIICDDGTVRALGDYDYSDMYKKCIANGTHFIIKDENSRIIKNGDFTFVDCTRYPENVVEYDPDLDFRA